jgi:hypothetical protein
MSVTEKLAEFARWALEDGSWQGRDLEGSDVQRKALALGIIKEVKYDPEVHGVSEFDEVKPGDPWFVLSGEVEAVLPTPK